MRQGHLHSHSECFSKPLLNPPAAHRRTEGKNKKSLVFHFLFPAYHMSMCIADRTVKSQGAPSPELSISGIGRLFGINGAWPTDQPPKSIQTAEKDEMAVGTIGCKKTSSPPLSASARRENYAVITD
ncbi:unnamed protein product [Pleuronectes platessa]|uniref:Uncharacterized protein n=1 Tax=Pleuronectes platessa TaxID=8262 RepID=A0A9N7TY72_PLEPL|nr:unnamed protein product [Pleuronectes platessa]